MVSFFVHRVLWDTKNSCWWSKKACDHSSKTKMKAQNFVSMPKQCSLFSIPEMAKEYYPDIRIFQIEVPFADTGLGSLGNYQNVLPLFLPTWEKHRQFFTFAAKCLWSQWSWQTFDRLAGQGNLHALFISIGFLWNLCVDKLVFLSLMQDSSANTGAREQIL